MRQLTATAKRITPADGHWLFGYYDIPSFDSECKRHLALHVPFMDHMPTKDDVAEIYCINLADGSREKIAETTAWCFQQSCFIQWLPAYPDTVIWNTRLDNECGYGAIIKNLRTGEQRVINRPVATVAPDGKHALSINFDRMFDFRPGYGYAGRRDTWYDVKHPTDDGVYLVDLETGDYKLIISLDQLWQLTGKYFGGEDQKVMINHINFNTDGSRFLFLLRNMDGAHWKTAILTANTDGSDVYVLSDFAYASHYYWLSPNVVSIHSSGLELGDKGNQLYELTDRTHTGRIVDADFFVRDGHVSYSPDREYILYDSYPLEDLHQELYLYDLKTGRGGLLGRFKSKRFDPVDIRCDLHPVWAPSGNMISFDSVFEGFRGIYTVDVTEARRQLREEP